MARTAIINVMAKACYSFSIFHETLAKLSNFKPLTGPEDFVKTADEKSKKLLDELCFARPDYGVIVKGGGLKSNDPKIEFGSSILNG